MPFGDSQQSTEKWQDEPGKDALHQPIAFPAPRLNLVNGHVATGLAECAYSDDK